jgi:hypothetical protein
MHLEGTTAEVAPEDTVEPSFFSFIEHDDLLQDPAGVKCP